MTSTHTGQWKEFALCNTKRRQSLLLTRRRISSLIRDQWYSHPIDERHFLITTERQANITLVSSGILLPLRWGLQNNKQDAHFTGHENFLCSLLQDEERDYHFAKDKNSFSHLLIIQNSHLASNTKTFWSTQQVHSLGRSQKLSLSDSLWHSFFR